MNKKGILFFSFFISFFILVFYLSFINLSSDTILLFLTAKIFLGRWLAKGIFPLFNPHIFAGVPFAFDLGLGNFHPFNLFFIFSYPWSISLWTAANAFLFIFGFFLFFSQFTKTKKFAFLLTLVLFFSGSGIFLRMNNPLILAVICHYGLFLYFLKDLIKEKFTGYLWPLVLGVFLTLSGHSQFVFYGYLLAAIIGKFIYKIKIKKLLIFFLVLFILTSWYYFFSLPLLLQSTRVAKEVSAVGRLHFFQLFQLVLPFILGEKYSGAKWNVGYSPVVNISLYFSYFLILLFLKKRVNRQRIIIMVFLFFLAFGFITLPFFRIASQIFVVIHIYGLTLIAQNEKFLLPIKKPAGWFLAVCLIFAFFSFSSYFEKFFTTLFYLIKKRPPGLFFDRPTIVAIGLLAGKSFFLLFLFFLIGFFISRFKKFIWLGLFSFLFFEAGVINFYFNYFIPATVIKESINKKIDLGKNADLKNYRLQSTADMIPYFGFNIYIDSVNFRPPFSKEKTFFDKKEKTDFSYLKSILALNPSSWAMVSGTKSVQGYATFVPQKIANFFSRPSADYQTVYQNIIKRNPTFTQQTISHINAINTSKITPQDRRWQILAVKYFLSDRELNYYQLIEKNENYIYENPEALPIFRKTDGKTPLTIIKETPNEIVFEIKKEEVGKKILININPDGFAGRLNSRPVKLIKRDFELEVDLDKAGELKIFFSPLLYFQESLKNRKFLL
ncbi:MAG: hypothetical protein QHH09_02075 [Microgenomates group bacterium]|nr:hypothetical protein [Microgenomates group bacterium]